MAFESDAVLRVGDVTFWGGSGDEGFFIDQDGFDGWDEAPTPRYENVEQQNAHGSFDAVSYYEQRLLVVSGTCMTGQGAGKLGWYASRFAGLFNDKVRVQVDYNGVQSFADGRLAARPRFQPVVPGSIARFQFSLRFADPRKYGELVPLDITPAGVAQPIYHRGNFDAAPQLVVRGSMPGYRIEGPGYSYTVDRAVTAATPHVIDNKTGLLSINGVVQFGAISSGSGWVIAAGSRPVTHKLVPVSGNGTLETLIRDTYI
jgi:hypothetical protein